MIKQDIVDNVANATGLTKVEVEAVLNESFSAIITALSKNEKIELRGFGTFSVKHRLPKKARNPKTEILFSYLKDMYLFLNHQS